MLFNVSGLIQEGIGAVRKHEVDGTLVSEGREPERVFGDVEFLRTKSGVLVRAHLKLEERESCSRCVKPLQSTLDIEFEEEFQQTVEASGRPVGERPDPEAFIIDDRHMLDLTEAVRQYREAQAEMQPLCRADCKGLCAECGGDLNENDCRCEPAIDQRWASLAGLRAATEQGKE
jgi:uncharacterized protein